MEPSVALWRAAGNERHLAYALGFLSEVEIAQGNVDAAAPLAAESLALFRQGDDRWGVAFALINLGNIAPARADPASAAELYAASADILRDIGERWLLALPLRNLARFAVLHGDYARATALSRESLILLPEPGERWYASRSLEDLARIAAGQGDHYRAARLLGAAAGLREAIGAPILPFYQAEYEHLVSAVHRALGADACATAWAAGRTLTLPQAIAEAFADTSPPATPAPTSASPPLADDLTPRGRQVPRLLGAGRSNQEIADTLSISLPTVKAHVHAVLAKFGLASRTAAAYAIHHGLA